MDADPGSAAVPSAPPEQAGAGRPSLLRNVAHLLSSQAITWILATVVMVVLPRYLGREGIGQLRLATAIWTITQLFINLGTSMYLTLEIAKDRERGSRMIGPIITLRVLLFVSTSALLIVGTTLGGLDTDTVVILLILGASILVHTVADVLSSALTGLERMSYPAMAAVASKLLYTGAILGVVVLDGGLRAVAATTLVAALTSMAICWWAIRKFVTVSFRQPFEGLPTIVRASMAFFAWGAVLIVYQQIDTVVIASMVDREVLGSYSTADTLFGTLLFVPTILMAALFPRFGRLHVADPPALARLVRQTFHSLLLLGVPIGLGTLVVADSAALTLYGPKFRETGPVLGVFGVVIILVFVTILFGAVATATGHQWFWNTLMIGAIVASVPLDLVLVPWTDRRFDNGAIGGALAYVVTESVMVGIGLWKVAPTLISRSSLVRTAKVLLAGGVMVASTWPLRDAFLAIPIAVGAFVYVIAVLALSVLTEDELSLARRGVARLGVRR